MSHPAETPPPTERLRAMHLIANLERGGAQEVVRTLAAALPQSGCHPVVVSLRDGPLHEELLRLGVEVRLVEGRTHSVLALHRYLPEIVRLRRELLRVADADRVDVIQTHLLGSLDFLALSLRLAGRRAVFWTVHNSQLELRADQLPSKRVLLWPKRWAYRWLYRLLSRRVDGFVAVSSEVADAVRRLYRTPRSKVVCIPNGVMLAGYPASVDRAAIRHSLGVADGAPLVTMVAKLMPQKGHAVLLAALPRLLADFPNLRVLLVGAGPLHDELLATIRRYAANDVVLLAGDRPDVPELLAASDLFVLPSLWEGLSMALLEAMASRLPVVASRVSGTSEVIEHGQSGLLVPPGNASALADAIARPLRDASLAQRLGEGARLRVEACYGSRAQAEQHVLLYRSVLASVRRGNGAEDVS